MPSVIPYEEQLAADLQFALTEASLFFTGTMRFKESLERVVSRFEMNGVAYAVSGDLAFFAHGYRKVQERIDILVENKSQLQFLGSHGYAAESDRVYRDLNSGLRIQFLFAGDPVGSKGVRAPSPLDVAVRLSNINFVAIESLIEFTLASLTPNCHYSGETKMLGLIWARGLDRSFRSKLAPSVWPDFDRLWDIAASTSQSDRP